MRTTFGLEEVKTKVVEPNGPFKGGPSMAQKGPLAVSG